MEKLMKIRKRARSIATLLMEVMLVLALPYRVARAAGLDGDLAQIIWTRIDPSSETDDWKQEQMQIFADVTGITSTTAASAIKWFPRDRMGGDAVVSKPWDGKSLRNGATAPSAGVMPTTHTSGTAQVVRTISGTTPKTIPFTSFTADAADPGTLALVITQPNGIEQDDTVNTY